MEKKILECNINGFKMLYTAEINNKNYLGDTNDRYKYLHVKCTVSNNNKTEKSLSFENVSTLTLIRLDSPNDIVSLVYEILYDFDISYYKNRFIKNLTEFIKEEYIPKLLDFDKLEYLFKGSLHKDKLSCVFDRSVFIPRKTNLDFDTKVEIYPYIFNNRLYLHIKVSYGNLTGPDSCVTKSVFEYELTNHTGVDLYKDTCGILSEIFDRGYVIPTINYSVDIMVNMIKYCFNENLFKNIEQI